MKRTFRIRILAAYDYTCALTGYRLTTVTAGSIVDAATFTSFQIAETMNSERNIALQKRPLVVRPGALGTISDDFQ